MKSKYLAVPRTRHQGIIWVLLALMMVFILGNGISVASATTTSTTTVLTSTSASADATVVHDEHPPCTTFGVGICQPSKGKPGCFILSRGDNDPDDWQCPSPPKLQASLKQVCANAGATNNVTFEVTNLEPTAIPGVGIITNEVKLVVNGEEQNLGTLQAHEVRAVTLRLAYNGHKSVTFRLSAPVLDGSTGDTKATTVTVQPFKDCPKVGLTKKVSSKVRIKSGKYKGAVLVTFKVTAQNAGLVATPVVIKDPVPAGFIVRPGDRAKLQGGAFVFKTTLAVGQSKTFTVTLIAFGKTGLRCNVASASAPGATTTSAKACTRFVRVALPRDPGVTG